MHNFHGPALYRAERRKRSAAFFEGWYLKHQNGKEAAAFIPSFHMSADGVPTASFQAITKEASYSVDFPASQFQAAKNKFEVRLGDCVFTEKGISLELKTNDFALQGKLLYGPFLRLSYPIMGPFGMLSFLQCYHGVVSVRHSITGFLILNGKKMDFTGGRGYIEKDWGCSFPSSYLWTQGIFQDNGGREISLMVSAASIPFPGKSFSGCICFVRTAGREYRLATYLGAKIASCARREVRIIQGAYCLEARLLSGTGCSLRAPVKGSMDRMIKENLCCLVQYRFWKNGVKLFDCTSNMASFESGESK